MPDCDATHTYTDPSAIHLQSSCLCCHLFSGSTQFVRLPCAIRLRRKDQHGRRSTTSELDNYQRFYKLCAVLDCDQSDIQLHCKCKRNWELQQFCDVVGQSGKHREHLQFGRIYASGGRNGDGDGDLVAGYIQVRIDDCVCGIELDDYQRICKLCAVLDCDQSDNHVRCECKRHGELQQFCDVVGQSVKHREYLQLGCIYACGSRNGDGDGDLDAG